MTRFSGFFATAVAVAALAQSVAAQDFGQQPPPYNPQQPPVFNQQPPVFNQQPPAVTQQQNAHIGQWACQFTYTELDRNGGRTGGHTREFGIAFYPNNAFEAYGTMASIAGYTQFQSQGSWQADPATGAIFARGPEQTNDPMQIPGMQFMFAGIPQLDGTLSSRNELPDPSGAYIAQRMLTACQRRG